ncbi:MAG: apolipoprotein N-acyltransferase, partial [Planctomycetia bacterium]
YSDPGAWIGWLMLAGYLSLYFPAFILFSRVLSRRWKLPFVLAMPIVWTALEFVRMHLMTGFGWFLLGHAAFQWSWTIQIADLAGVYAVSFLLATVNAQWIELLIVPLVRRVDGRLRVHPRQRWRLLWTASLVGLTMIYGIFSLRQGRFVDGPKLVLVHTALEQSLKQNDPNVVFTHALEATQKIVDRKLPADMVVWPETTYPFLYGSIAGAMTDLEIDRRRLARRPGVALRTGATATEEAGAALRQALRGGEIELNRLADQLDRPILVGTLRTVVNPDECRQYNASVLLAPRQGAVGAYDKVHLVPFGEYLPLEQALPQLRFLTPYGDGVDFFLDHSTAFQTIHHLNLNFAALICFEDTLPHLAREFMRRATPEKPVEFLVNQSNDGWFLGSVEADHHLAASLFRAVECRRSLVRATNMGATCLVDPNGKVRHRTTDPREPTVLEVVVPLDSRRTMYVAWGDWLPLLCGAVVATGVLFSTARHAARIAAILRRKRPT